MVSDFTTEENGELCREQNTVAVECAPTAKGRLRDLAPGLVESFTPSGSIFEVKLISRTGTTFQLSVETLTLLLD